MAKTKLYTVYMGLYGAPTRHVFKIASLAVSWMLSLNLWRTKSQKSGQIYRTVLPRKAYYSSTCMSAINKRHDQAMRM